MLHYNFMNEYQDIPNYSSQDKKINVSWFQSDIDWLQKIYKQTSVFLMFLLFLSLFFLIPNNIFTSSTSSTSSTQFKTTESIQVLSAFILCITLHQLYVLNKIKMMVKLSIHN